MGAFVNLLEDLIFGVFVIDVHSVVVTGVTLAGTRFIGEFPSLNLCKRPSFLSAIVAMFLSHGTSNEAHAAKDAVLNAGNNILRYPALITALGTAGKNHSKPALECLYGLGPRVLEVPAVVSAIQTGLKDYTNPYCVATLRPLRDSVLCDEDWVNYFGAQLGVIAQSVAGDADSHMYGARPIIDLFGVWGSGALAHPLVFTKLLAPGLTHANGEVFGDVMSIVTSIGLGAFAHPTLGPRLNTLLSGATEESRRVRTLEALAAIDQPFTREAPALQPLVIDALTSASATVKCAALKCVGALGQTLLDEPAILSQLVAALSPTADSTVTASALSTLSHVIAWVSRSPPLLSAATAAVFTPSQPVSQSTLQMIEHVLRRWSQSLYGKAAEAVALVSLVTSNPFLLSNHPATVVKGLGPLSLLSDALIPHILSTVCTMPNLID